MLIAGVTTAHVDPTMARTWLAAVHQVARETGHGGHVLSPAKPPTVGRNHYLVQVAIDDRRLRLLLNAGASVVAAADGADPHALTPAFRAVPRPALFIAVGLHVAAPAELEQPLTEAHLIHLDASERQGIAYHRPPRLGDDLFNWFD